MVRCLCCAVIVLAGSLSFAEPVPVPLVTYYNYPPFMDTAPLPGLNEELAVLLTQRSGRQFAFSPEFLPKGRVDVQLEDPSWRAAVAWINPVFVNDEQRSKYRWSPVLFEETDWVASRKNSPFEYHGVSSLAGRTLGAVLNQRYADVEDMIASGTLRRDDAPSQEQNLMKLLVGRVDTVFVSSSTLSWFEQDIPELETGIHLSSEPRNHFGRQLMLTHGFPPAQQQALLELLAQTLASPSWKALLDKYHVGR